MSMSEVGAYGEYAFKQPLARQTVQELVYQRLSYALMTGQFDPGKTLTISYLSDLFGTSHMPVREALRRLTAENALETTSTGSSRVPAVTRSRLDDLCDARTVVERAAAERSVGNIKPPLLRALEHNLADHIAAGEEGRIPVMLQKNQEFHFMIYRASGSVALVQLIEALWLRFGPFLRMLSDHLERDGGNKAGYTGHHRDMISAIKRGDARALGDHIEQDVGATQHLLQGLCTEAEEAQAPTAC